VTALLIGFGNPDCGDDAAGPLVARLLAGRINVRVLERHGDALALIDEWRGAEALVLIDAAAPMGTPGRIHRVDIAAADLPRDLSVGSTHAFGLPEAVALSRRLGTLPARAMVYAIEGVCFDPGAPVSPAVAEAVAGLAKQGEGSTDAWTGLFAARSGGDHRAQGG
jgi:hydrogenase maturation protease